MSTVALVLIVIGAVLLALFLGGLVVARRRVQGPEFAADVARADRALEAARASDRGWDRALLEQAARDALAAERPAFKPDALELVLVDDRPGMEEDRAHLLAVGADGNARVVLCRDAEGRWSPESID